MTVLGYTEVLPIKEHARLIMEWRNDPNTLAMSYDPTPKIWANFWTEFQKEYFTVPRCSPLFCLQDQQAVAFIRFRPIHYRDYDPAHSCEISINLDPLKRGKGLGTLCLELASDYLREKGYHHVVADIKKDNRASHKIFRKAGYEPVETSIFRGEEVSRYVHTLMPRHLGTP